MNALPPFDDPGWTLLDGATPDAASARTGDVGLSFGAEGGTIDPPNPGYAGGASHALDVFPGTERQVSVWVRRNVGSGIVGLSVEDPVGSENWASVAMLVNPTLGAWVELAGPYTPVAGSLAVKVQAVTPPGQGSSDWSADDAFLDDMLPVEVTAMQRGLRLAWLDIRTRLLTIEKGAGYYHDLKTVLSRNDPTRVSDLREAYACLPAGHVSGEYEWEEPGTVVVPYRQPVFIYPLDAPTEDPRQPERTGVSDLWNWHDDLCRCLAYGHLEDASQTRITRVRVAEVEVSSELTENLPPHLRFVIVGDVRIAWSELGPQGE